MDNTEKEPKKNITSSLVEGIMSEARSKREFNPKLFQQIVGLILSNEDNKSNIDLEKVLGASRSEIQNLLRAGCLHEVIIAWVKAQENHAFTYQHWLDFTHNLIRSDHGVLDTDIQEDTLYALADISDAILHECEIQRDDVLALLRESNHHIPGEKLAVILNGYKFHKKNTDTFPWEAGKKDPHGETLIPQKIRPKGATSDEIPIRIVRRRMKPTRSYSHDKEDSNLARAA